MKLKILLLIIISFFLPNINKSFAQDTQQTYKLGLDAFSLGSYENAIYHLKRAIFFGKEHDFVADAHKKIAESYLFLGDYRQAGYYYDLANTFEQDKDNRIENIFSKTNCLIMTNEHNLAIVELLSTDFHTPEQIRRKNFYMANIYYDLTDYENARYYFKLTCQENPKIDEQEFEAVLARIKKIKKNKGLIWLSVIPGFSQLVMGDVKNGVGSMAVNTGFMYLMINTALNYGFPNAVLSVGPWFHRYYAGGLKNAERVADKKRLEKKAEVKKEILEYIYSHS